MSYHPEGSGIDSFTEYICLKKCTFIAMRRIHVLILMGLFFSLLTACSAEQRKRNQHIPVKPTLLHPFFFQEELTGMLNFPFWFNDSILASKGIESLEHTVMAHVHSDDDGEYPSFPKRTVRYTFNRKGQLIHIQMTDYSEGIIIAHQSYKIQGTTIPYYTAAMRLDNTYGVENSSYLVVPAKRKKNVLQFENFGRGERIHFIQKKRFWGVLSVDSIANPRSYDWVVLGTPVHPVKRYKVRNKVKESQVTEYTYKEKDYPLTITGEDYPFTRKRTFHYNKQGHFDGFTDSTFIENSFVTRTTVIIDYNKQQEPVTIVRLKGHADGQHLSLTREKLRYTYFVGRKNK
jgi:hypothetical protein